MPQLENLIDVRAVITTPSAFGPQEIARIVDAMAKDFGQYRSLRDGIQELEQQPEPSPATKVRLGVGCFLLGRYRLAVEYLSRADGSALAQFYLAKAHLAQRNAAAAIDSFEAAAKAGYNADSTLLGRIEALRLQSQHQVALQMLDQMSGPVLQTAEYLYQRGATLAALGEANVDVVPLFEKAVELDPHHPGALFGLALENDRSGNDDLACQLYERSVQRFPPHLGTLLNLGILYEDHEQYDKAAMCYRRILVIHPEHQRAKLFLKDAEASFDMVVDEMAEKRSDRMNQVLGTPVTDFELSVRSRNCLQKMGIKTLGDLSKISEQDLLSSKNFGETSLNEIKEMMTSKGLRLGQHAETKRPTDVSFDPATMSPDEQALLAKGVAELNLSVRARKCMIRLGINTIGELIRCTGDELLECKNFGVTSLNEVREKLTAYNLKLRGE